ncbi:MAG TPA: hypothetical protein VGB66_17455 [Longimicrobium sp.]|jgi:hypothetical protein
MAHAAEGTLLEMLDGRLPQPHQAQLQGHVAECASCAAELDRLRRLSATFDAAMAALDPPAPTRAALAAVRSRRRGGWMTDTRRTLAKAAILVLGVVGVASATLPGSPLRQWMEQRFGGAAPTPATAAAAAPSPGAPPATEATAGVEILPHEGAVRVVLGEVGPGLRVRVRLADADYVDVRATGAAAGAQFRTAPGRVSITGAAEGEIVIALPRAVRRAAIVVGDRTYMTKDGEQIHVLAPAADTVGAEIVFPVAP